MGLVVEKSGIEIAFSLRTLVLPCQVQGEFRKKGSLFYSHENYAHSSV
jgi:hypothetical protein